MGVGRGCWRRGGGGLESAHPVHKLCAALFCECVCVRMCGRLKNRQKKNVLLVLLRPKVRIRAPLLTSLRWIDRWTDLANNASPISTGIIWPRLRAIKADHVIALLLARSCNSSQKQVKAVVSSLLFIYLFLFGLVLSQLTGISG